MIGSKVILNGTIAVAELIKLSIKAVATTDNSTHDDKRHRKCRYVTRLTYFLIPVEY